MTHLQQLIVGWLGFQFAAVGDGLFELGGLSDWHFGDYVLVGN